MDLQIYYCMISGEQNKIIKRNDTVIIISGFQPSHKFNNCMRVVTVPDLSNALPPLTGSKTLARSDVLTK